MRQNAEERGPLGSLENLTGSAKEYIDMRLDSFKLKVVENLSLLFSKILYILLLIVILGVALIFTASALSLYLGDLLNSKVVGALITAGVLLLVAVGIILKRKTMFLNSMVKMFISLFFKDENLADKEEEL